MWSPGSSRRKLERGARPAGDHRESRRGGRQPRRRRGRAARRPTATPSCSGPAARTAPIPASITKLSYDPVRDFVPVVQVTTSPLVLIVPPALPANSVDDLIAMARSKPGELSFASYGTGSINHLRRRTVQRDGQDPGEPYPVSRRRAGADRPDGGPDSVHLRRRRDLARLRAAPAASAFSASPARSARRSSRTCRRSPKARCRASIPRSGSGCSRRPGRRRPSVDIDQSQDQRGAGHASLKESFAKLGIEGVGGTPDVLAARVTTEMEKWAKLVRERNLRFDQ